jgi:hypothetical protein
MSVQEGEQEEPNTSLTCWPSVDNVKPVDEGGPVARTGFNYQDEIAVGFLVEMLETPTLLKVHCETHDDILLVHASGETARSRRGRSMTEAA